MTSQKSTFPIALGVRITGVDDSTFSATGESYSTISLPMADTHTSKVLQEDDTALGESLPSTRVLERPLFANECHSHSSITTCLCAQPTSLRASVRLRFALTPLTLCRADTQTHKPRACKHSPRLHVGEHRGECAPPPFKHSMTTQNVHSMLTRVSCVTEGIHEVCLRALLPSFVRSQQLTTHTAILVFRSRRVASAWSLPVIQPLPFFLNVRNTRLEDSHPPFFAMCVLFRSSPRFGGELLCLPTAPSLRFWPVLIVACRRRSPRMPSACRWAR